MNRIARVLPMLVVGVLMSVPAGAQSQQQIDDLRRRVEEVERQLFQQRLAVPAAPASQGLDQLQARVRQLELEIASERVSRMAAAVASKPTPPAKAEPKTLEARVAELEAQRAEDAKTIAAIVKRIEALEKRGVAR
ncbi:MAG TPA: hypothetical protein VFZ36_06105 [Vicinamibacterales bacterium]